MIRFAYVRCANISLGKQSIRCARYGIADIISTMPRQDNLATSILPESENRYLRIFQKQYHLKENYRNLRVTVGKTTLGLTMFFC